jgi:hypothetical protein
VGFALWIDGDTAWCAGTHEYRPMGVAVIAVSSLFSARDFHGLRQAPGERSGDLFRGLFASLPDVNFYLERRRRQLSDPVPAPKRRAALRRQLAVVHPPKL